MKIGISAFAWTSHFDSSHLDLLPAMKQIGLDGIEIPMFDPALLPVAEIKDACASQGLGCTVCSILPSYANPISPHMETRARAIEHLVQCVETAASMGANLIGGPLFAPIGYLPGHRPSDAEWTWAVEAFRALEHVLDANNMNLSVEPVNRSETFFLRTAAEARQLCESIGNPRIGVTIDTFHANIEEQSIPRAICALGSRLKHIHASENDRGLLGAGHVPFSEIISALREIGYEGYLMIEGFGYDKDAKDSPGQLWAPKSLSPERLAQDGFRYLTQMLQMVGH